MSNPFAQQVEQYLTSSAHLSKRHVHPRMMKLLEMGGMNSVFNKAEGTYFWDTDGNKYLDFLSGGGVYFLGRNHPTVTQYLQGVLELDLPNLSIVNASVLGGILAEKLLSHAGEHFGKVIYANSGTEATDVMLRFARYVTGKRRFLYLDGSFHGRSFAAISVCGWKQLKQGMEPVMPTVTPITPNDLRQLRREMRMGDVAGVILEPLQGMTCLPMDPGYLREVELLCKKHGALFLADEVQTGLGRTGHWFRTNGLGVRPDMMSVSKILSGGQVPVSAVLYTPEVYEAVYSKFDSGPIYFSTFAENNLAMAAALATIDTLEEIDGPAEAARKGKYLKDGLEEIATRYDCIEKVQGDGMIMAVYFKDSSNPALLAQQKIMGLADGSSFAASMNVDMFKRHKVIVQIPGPGLNAIKILPPVIATQDDMDWFLNAFEDSLSRMYDVKQGPLVSLGSGLVKNVMQQAVDALPEGMVPPALKSQKKKQLS